MANDDAAATLTFCIDGGGTNSRGRLLGPAGTVLAAATSGPCNPSTNRGQAVASLVAIWQACCLAAGHDAEDRAHVALAIGAAGMYMPGTSDDFLSACPRFARVSAMSDGYAALIGAGGGAPCGLLIAGTGIAGHRLYADGRSIQRDAWGWLGGDRGSAAWLGRKALRHCFAAIDGVRAVDPLARAVLAAMGGFDGIASGWMRDMTPDRLGSLAPILLEQAAAGNRVALKARRKAVRHLARLIGVLDVGDVALYAAGGVVGPLRPLLAEELGRAVLAPQADALTGCWLVSSGQAPPERAELFDDAKRAFS